jgi:hypothetical protein
MNASTPFPSTSFSGQNALFNFVLISLVDSIKSIFEFIYCCETNESKENNFIEIYVQQSGKLKLLFKEKGSLIAYKIQPNTKEMILFHHKYPCCRTVSHNINMIRMVNNKIHLRQKYFVVNPEDTSFKIFPNFVHYSSKYYYLKNNKKIFSFLGENLVILAVFGPDTQGNPYTAFVTPSPCFGNNSG